MKVALSVFLRILICYEYQRNLFVSVFFFLLITYHNLRAPNLDTKRQYTVELQWLEHLWDHENEFKSGVVRANEC